MRNPAALILLAVLGVASLLLGCGGGSDATMSADSPDSEASQQKASSSTDQEDCSPHYIEGDSGDEVAASLSSLFTCVISPDGPKNEAELNELLQYVLGPNELAARQYTNTGSLITLWHTLSERLYPENPGARNRFEISCGDIGEVEVQGIGLMPTLEASETMISEGYENDPYNGEATEYNDYMLIPTTPKAAGFDDGNQRIWTVLWEATLGESGGSYPTAHSCEQPIPWNGPVDSLGITLH